MVAELNLEKSAPVIQPLVVALAVVQSNDPLVPPTKLPSVPEYVIGDVTVGVEVPMLERVFTPEK